MNAISDTNLHEIEITARKQEADGIISLELRRSDRTPLPPFEAGSHIDLHIAPDCVRQYSLYNDPQETDRYCLGILLDPASRGGSVAVHSGLPTGARISISSPRNHFPLKEDAGHSILFAGGIGITPIYAMARRLHGLGSSFNLHYCSRSASRAAFRDDLANGPFGDRLFLHMDDEGPAFDIAEAIGTPDEATHIYVCGPAGFIDAVTATARQQGWPDENIHVEHFGADINSSGDSFEVEAVQSGITVQVGPDESIAQALQKASVSVPLSCEQGVCGTCLTRIISGKADHRDLFLSEDEREAGEELAICCSRSLTPTLVLDI